MNVRDGMRLGIGFLAIEIAFTSIVGIVGFIIGKAESTWPESAEFYQLYTGQDRFSEHSTNLNSMTVVVDHQTGTEYLRTPEGICPLLDVDGEPLREAEAGADE